MIAHFALEVPDHVVRRSASVLTAGILAAAVETHGLQDLTAMLARRGTALHQLIVSDVDCRKQRCGIGGFVAEVILDAGDLRKPERAEPVFTPALRRAVVEGYARSVLAAGKALHRPKQWRPGFAECDIAA